MYDAGKNIVNRVSKTIVRNSYGNQSYLKTPIHNDNKTNIKFQ